MASNDVLALARAHAAAAEYDKSLRAYLWCLQTLETNGMTAGVLAIYIPAEVGAIAKRYAPARQALIQYRNTLERHLGHDTQQDPFLVRKAGLYAELNRNLDDHARGLVFVASGFRDDSVRLSVWEAVLESLVRSKEYRHCRARDDLSAALVESWGSRESSTRALGPIHAAVSRRFVSIGSQLFECFIGSGDDSKALELAAQLVAVARDTAAQRLRSAAEHAGRPDILEELVRRVGLPPELPKPLPADEPEGKRDEEHHLRR
jgi:hypothetical protein